MKHTKRTYLEVILLSYCILVLAPLAYAGSATSSSFRVIETTAAAKGYAESSSFKVYTSTGQPAPIQVSTSSSFTQQGGFIRHLVAPEVFILNLTEVPWYANGLSYYTGAATAQMILNYIREGAGYPALAQNEIYTYGHPASDQLDMNPADLDRVLGHFDPYDEIISNSHDTYDSLPDGNPYQGYNFTADQHNSSDLTGYLRNICHWMAYKVRQEAWWSNGAYVARPNTPAALPFYGNYNWVAVKGFAADQNPTPDPLNPFIMPDFTVYGFWFKDPKVSGIGQDTYKTAAESIASYLLPLTTGDTYNGKFIQISEPPPQESQAQVTIAQPVSKAGILIQSGLRSSSGTAQTMLGTEENNSVTCESLVDEFAASDPEFREAVKNTQLNEIITVRGLVGVGGAETGKNYDLLSFGKETESGYQTFAVVRLGAEDAVFKEVSWVKDGQKYPKVSKEEAIQLARPYLVGYRPASFVADAVWWRTADSLTPLQPLWRISYFGTALAYVTQQGTVIRKPKKNIGPVAAIF